MPAPKIKIDQDVYKLRDSKVAAMLSGKIPVEVFILLIRPGDPYVLVNDTVYALTESEFYALRGVKHQGFPESEFKRLVQTDDLSFMSEADAAFMRQVRKDLPTCPACRYRRYRDAVLKLAKKYGMQIKLDEADTKGAEYPGADEELTPKVTALLSGMYRVPAAERRPCMDCVEKHLAQAWVLSNEAVQGYPEYVSMVAGHLGEAIAETPPGLEALRNTLVFCLARTTYDRRPFVPLHLLLPLVYAGRRTMSLDSADPEDDRVPLDNTLMQLELDAGIAAELAALPVETRENIADSCSSVDKIIPEVENPGDNKAVAWEGAMGALADSIAQIAPSTANMLRNRRLMFKTDPRLAAEAGYTLDDVALACQNVNTETVPASESDTSSSLSSLAR